MSKIEVSVSRSAISYEAAMQVTQAAMHKAEDLGVKICVAVVDSSAILTAFCRMNGAFLISNEIAQRKARCAAGLGFPPEVGDEILAAEPPRVREGLLSVPDFIQIRGGLPIYEGERLIGAIGVSGASEAQDVLCAKAGLAALGL